MVRNNRNAACSRRAGASGLRPVFQLMRPSSAYHRAQLQERHAGVTRALSPAAAFTVTHTPAALWRERNSRDANAFVEAKHQVHVLDGLPCRTLDEIVDH